ncbi:succinate dehydrogenase assembly factor 2 [Tulasnella sp. JGI-2019a]|nr:succinate dehydrogenase assembly factor 2 [Tulasnella sp. JGI-2019a]KAG8998911.1 succinate dehydrogenase assembly factor 2 [Tulasnella sp. JGI-2019a]
MLRLTRYIRPNPLIKARHIHRTSLRQSDPYPIPLQSHQHSPKNDSDVATKTPGEGDDLPEEFLPKPLARPDEDIDTIRTRLVYQSRKRGMLEGDLLLSTFAKENLGKMSLEELKEFDKLLDEPDWDIYYWLIYKRDPPERWAGSLLLEKLRIHTRNEGKVVRRMPDLATP